ncbi:BspC domain-containing protein [Burkholderia sp. TSV86]|uniref:BspC domain-containing protein n=1 Tax=Burkholderia sp. TSV86 TaxID=1385594 RepID=UPI0007582D94|nr:hypothetical protein [Burkholderia sp. TSV86]KVE39142.1 hypothetical protein WS68_20250 [Burkholderia sp. TSV86]
MDSFPAPQRLLGALGTLTACIAGLTLAFAAPAFADLLDQRAELVNKYINDMHADPLVADCAAHGNFIASTSNSFDHVEFPPSAFESDSATIVPWNDSFDEGKQRVKVDNVVTVEGLGMRNDGGEPAHLKFRCGYVGTQMLAFSWNDPSPPVKPRAARPAASKAKFHKHAGKGKGKGKAKASGKSGKRSSTVKAVKKHSARKAR